MNATREVPKRKYNATELAQWVLNRHFQASDWGELQACKKDLTQLFRIIFNQAAELTIAENAWNEDEPAVPGFEITLPDSLNQTPAPSEKK